MASAGSASIVTATPPKVAPGQPRPTAPHSSSAARVTTPSAQPMSDMLTPAAR